MLGVSPHPGGVVGRAHPPRPRTVTAHDRSRDSDSRPIEVAVVEQLAATASDYARELYGYLAAGTMLAGHCVWPLLQWPDAGVHAPPAFRAPLVGVEVPAVAA